MSDDPRQPRPNPELKAWERIIARECAALRHAETLAERRGAAAILREALEMYLAEPSELVDLVPGSETLVLYPVQIGDQWHGSPSPFVSEADTEAHYFYQGGDGSITPLLTEAQCALVDPWRLVGYVVMRWRRVYLTAGETRCHLTSQAALERIRSRSRRADLGRKHDYAVFLDPAGLRGGRVAPILSKHRRLQDARRRADAITERLEIRCLVAVLEGSIDIH
jgi:hypothetical protein